MPAAPLVDLSAFIADAAPGSSFEYFRGVLTTELADPRTSDDARRVRALAFTAQHSGGFDLLQKRLDEDDYAYLIRRRSGRGAPA